MELVTKIPKSTPAVLYRKVPFESPGTDPCFCSSGNKGRHAALVKSALYVYKHTVMQMRVTRVYSDVKRCPAIKTNK